MVNWSNAPVPMECVSTRHCTEVLSMYALFLTFSKILAILRLSIHIHLIPMKRVHILVLKSMFKYAVCRNFDHSHALGCTERLVKKVNKTEILLEECRLRFRFLTQGNNSPSWNMRCKMKGHPTNQYYLLTCFSPFGGF